jgi:hypothetical protein
MDEEQDIAGPDDLSYQAWGVIANARDWLLAEEGDQQSIQWREAAIRWRDRFHASLDALT